LGAVAMASAGELLAFLEVEPESAPKQLSLTD
jgi:hypothetical protein